jgi:ferredoxin--NADP+ reductase
VQAAFTNPELKEFGELAEAEVIVHPDDIELDPYSNQVVLSGEDRNAERNMQTLMRYSTQGAQGKHKRIHMLFLVSPTKIDGETGVESIELVHNELYKADDGSLRPRATGKTSSLAVGLVFRSIGYKGVPLPGVPFDQRAAVIPNVLGRVIGADAQPVTGEYAVGWIKRGPSGIIGTNKPDAQESVDQLLADFASGKLLTPSDPSQGSIDALLKAKGVQVVSFPDWLKLDALEVQRGMAQGRPRVKFTRVSEMLDALREARSVDNMMAD